MKSTRIIAIAATVAFGVLYAGGASAQTSDVRIVRGGQPASIAETREAGVRVFRGMPGPEQIATAEPAVAASKVELVGAGSSVWLVDHEAGWLQVCSLVSTTQVGERRIDCHSRALPR